jgi:hypothetical protein
MIGNDDVIPFAQLNNPAQDNDQVVWSDAPYACTKDHTYLIPDKIIARIPDEMVNPSWDYLETVLKNQIAWTQNKSKNTGWFHLAAFVWTSIATYMHNEFNMDELNISPNMTYRNLTASNINKKLSYINLHGTNVNGNFYNQQGSTFDIALIPQQGNFTGNLVFTEACYGGYVIGRNKEMSIPMMGLYSNAIGFICSSTVAYGPSGPPAQSADLLAECFFKRILSGESLGQALLDAKTDFATQTMKQFGSMNGAARKTLLQFHLYGIPTIAL